MQSLLWRRVRRRWREMSPRAARYAAALVVATVHLYAVTGPLGKRVEPLANDAWFRVRGTVAAPQDIAIIAIDERSYHALGLSMLDPWPRAKHVELLEKLQRLNVKRVIFDMLFEYPGKDPAVDASFAESLKLVPAAIGEFRKYERRTSLDGLEQIVTTTLEPLPIFSQAASYVFLVNLLIDDGAIRRFFLDETKDPAEPSLAKFVRPDPPAAKLSKSAAPSPADFINYYGPPGTVRSISYDELLATPEETLVPLLRDKTVFVGIKLAVAPGIPSKDSFYVPVSPVPMYGVEIHATAAANIMHGEWIRRFPAIWEVPIVNVSAFLLAVLLSFLRPTRGALVLLGTAATWCGASYALFLNHYFLPGLLLITTVLPLLFALNSFYYYLILQRSQRDMEKALGVKLHVR